MRYVSTRGGSPALGFADVLLAGLARSGRARVTIAVDSLVPGVPPHTTAKDGELVHALESLTGQSSRAVMFCTEAPFFASLGMETVVCGAGSIDVAHQPNEYTSRDGLDAATELYAQTIARFCA